MIEKIKAYRCSCWCGHKWISETESKRCAKCKSRKWNTDSPKPSDPATDLADIFGKEESPKPKKSSKSPAEIAGICPECFALNRQHQKSCSKRK